MHLRMSRIVGACALLLVIGCKKYTSVDLGVGTGRGIVRRIDFEHHQITLEHGVISNLVHPMTYAYPVRSDSLMKPFSEGDTVSVTIKEDPPGQFVVLSLKRIHRGYRAE